MKELKRRDFLKMVGISASAFAISPNMLKAGTTTNIVIVGGGFAGATCAKYLKLWGGYSVNVVVVEPNSTYVSPILSNLIINDKKSLSDISFSYDNHISKYGISLLYKSVSSIDKRAKKLNLSDNTTLSYEHLVLAPGIDFVPVNGHDFTKVPHAWQAGVQTTLLKNQIDSMVDGDDIIISIPKSPYRCPPGPYERACIVADYLKNIKYFSNSKVIVLDANPKIIVEESTFSSAFNAYGVEYIPNTTILSVDSDNKSVEYEDINGNTYTKNAKVLNIIPKQKAAKVIFDAGLNSGDWASVDPISYESTLEDSIYIIGDSQGTSQPKAGHIANNEAKICADAILRKINNLSVYPNPKTNSACYSPISTTKASWLTAVYEYDPINKSMKLVSSGNYPAAGVPSTSNYKTMFDWAENLFMDSFS